MYEMKLGMMILLLSVLVGVIPGATSWTTNWPWTTEGWLWTTDFPSCRWNCGNYFLSCDCSSSCDYYGSCCPDYYNYCYSTTMDHWETTTEPTTGFPIETTEFPSCRWNCDYNFGSCSCSSSCQYYGNCCSDYYDYCYTTTMGYWETTTEPTTGFPTETTDFPSCRWNCGYNLHSCSCSSSCQYYGNCCPDYYDNCYTTTTGYWETTSDFPSCRWNCGYNLGSCSCSSSCQYNGQCCPDYYDYCYTTTTTEIITTTDFPSCRWDCGYNFGSCSCSSSCQYYGNCCPDYYDYCYSTTTGYAETTSAPPSCMWNCGYDYGSCSCSSSCQYYGNCCPDYYDYCGTTTFYPYTGTGGAPCGEDLTDPSGEFFSPQYPNNYPDNARCTWRLQAPEGQAIDVSFTFVELEECCDSIRVYDGPSEHYPLLGRLPQDQIYHFNSSTNYLTVVFSTDFSVTRRGFRAQWMFTVTHTPCGGQFSGSGSISSPYYPDYYHDNAYCLWRLSAPSGQSVFLSFVDLQLDRCCYCDYVSVYDGSSTSSPLLGKLCNNDTTLRDFRSSSSYMTVLFRSDSSGVARGFQALFTNSLSESRARVTCSSDSMNIVIRRSYLDSLGISWYDLYVDDHRCRPTADSYEVSFNFPVYMCGTSTTANHGRVVYNNHVRAVPTQSGEITREVENFLLNVNCHMEQETTVGTVYKVKELINNTISGTGRFNASINFYPSSSFPYPITETPYEVDLNQYLYVQVHLDRADGNLDILLDSCITSPNPDFTARSYTLIQNGCKFEDSVYIYTNGLRYFAQFRFRAFKFLRTHSLVYLRCNVIVCADNDSNSRCSQGCRHTRKKRSLGSSHHTETVTLGPITLKGAKSAAQAEEEE